MTVAAMRTREDKLNWLVRPFDWAARTSLTVLALFAMAWVNQDVSPESMRAVAILTLVVVGGLILWGIRRFTSAAQKRT